MTPLLLSLLSGVLHGLAFPPVALPALAWVALVPLFVALARVRPRHAAGLGAVMALVGALGVTWWFPSMVTAYFGKSTPIGWLVWLAFCTASVAVPLVAFAAWTSWMAARGAASPLLVAAAWGTYEFVRARLGVGNPWALLGYSQMDWLRVVQIADLTGPYGPGMLVAGVNATLAGLLAPRLRGRHFGASVVSVACAVAMTVAYGTWRLSEPLAAGETVMVAVVQPAVPAAARRTEAGRALALERQLTASREAVGRGARLVVWPENAIDFYLDEPSPARDAFVAAVRALDVGDVRVDVVLGGPGYVHAQDGLRYRNSVYLLKGGAVAGRYDKLHLLPFAEATYEPGTHTYALRSQAGLVSAFVCFEAMYPELVRRLVTGGAGILANLSNDAWFGAVAPARLHLAMARLRAVEQRRWLVRATTTGISAIVDPYGRIVRETASDVPAVLEGSVRPSQVVTPYQRWGDLTAWLATGVVGVATMMAYVGERRRPHGGAS